MSVNINLHQNEENEKIENIINGITTHYNWFYNFQGLDDKNKYLFNVPNFFIIKYKEIKKVKLHFINLKMMKNCTISIIYRICY